MKDQPDRLLNSSTSASAHRIRRSRRRGQKIQRAHFGVIQLTGSDFHRADMQLKPRIFYRLGQ
jgi:hypothetical protein